MNAAFLNEWQLYRRGAQLPPIVGLEPKTDSEFDAGVAVDRTDRCSGRRLRIAIGG